MRSHLCIGLAIAACTVLAACGDSTAPASGAASGSPTAKAAPTTSATTAATTTAAAPASASATAAPAAAGKVPGIKDGEIVAGSCNTIEKDSECGEVVVTAEADKPKSMEVLKKICKGSTAESACSADKMVGSCRVGKDIINHYYSDGPKAYKADTAKTACEKGFGRWVTP